MPTPRRKPAAKKKPAAKTPAAPKPRKPVTDGLPLLAPGSAHPVVIECARKLESAGHGSSPAARGESGTGVLGPEELGQFTAFNGGAAPTIGDDVYVTPELIAAVLAS